MRRYLILLLAGCAAAGAAGASLAPNAGFEKLENGRPAHWWFDHSQTDAFGVDAGRSGKRCVWTRLKNSAHASWWSDWFPVKPNATYDVEVWVKTDRPAGGGGVRLGVAFDTHSAPACTRTLPAGRWMRLATTVRTWPKTTRARIRLLVRKWEGQVWFDDAAFRPSAVDWMKRFPHTDLSRLKLSGAHPCVAFTPKEIAELRRAVRAIPWAKKAFASYLASGRRLLKNSPFRLPDYDFAKVGPGYRYMKGVARAAKDLGFLYQLTQERRYAAAARERLVAIAKRLPKGNLCRGGYGYVTGYALHNAAIGYDFIYDSDALSAADRRLIESMLRAGFRGMSRHGDVMSINNRGAVCLGAMASIAFGLQDRGLIEWVVNGPYGFNYHMQFGVGDDGIWIEGVSYGFMAMGKIFDWYCGYMAVAEAAHRAGLDLYSHPRFKRLFDAPLEYAYPDYGLPANGHCAYGQSLLGEQRARRYIKAWIRLRDPRYLWVISEGLKVHDWLPLGYGGDLYVLAGHLDADFSPGPAPVLKSELFPQVGHAMLRAGQGDDAMAALFDYGHFGSHGNPDKLSITFFAHGHLLSPDGITGYWRPETFMYECQTIGHNTVVVDERTQFPTGSKTLNAWLPARGVTMVDAQDEEANAGVAMRRTLALTDRYLLDVFTVAGDRPHRYDWAFHAFGALQTSVPLTPQAGTLGVTDGYQYLTGVRRGETGKTWSAEWDLNEMNLVWNASFELQTGKPWQVVDWRIPEASWRQFVRVDAARPHAGRLCLRITQPQGSREPVRLIAVGRPLRFHAGKRYHADAFVRVSDPAAAAGEVGVWIGDRLVCKLSRKDAAAAAKGWVAIQGVYRPKTTKREFLRIGVKNVTGADVWFDDVRLCEQDGRAHALKLTMLAGPDTEVITSDCRGLRPFQQPQLIVRRRGERTTFVAVFEPYYGRPAVESVRALGPRSVEIATRRTVDRYLVSDAARREAGDGLSVKGKVGAVSTDRATRQLRWLCLANGDYVSAGGWSLSTAGPATLCLEREARGLVLRAWGAYRGVVSVQGPGVVGLRRVCELSAAGAPARDVRMAASPRGARFAIEPGKAYALTR